MANPAEDRTSIDPATSISVEFDDARDRADPLPVDPARLMELLRATLEAEGVSGPAQVGLSLVDPAEIAQLNAEHLDGEGPTDVLSFPLEPFADPDWPAGPGEPARLIGDVVVCPAVAEAQAAAHAGSPADELALLVVHAGLHLTGHDHAEPAEAAAMVTREREILKRCWGPLAGDPWATP